MHVDACTRSTPTLLAVAFHALRAFPSWQGSFCHVTVYCFSLNRGPCLRIQIVETKIKVLAAEGHKGVPLDPALADLLQGLLKLDSRHRLSARNALASAYFAPRQGLEEETVSVDDCLIRL